MRSSTFPETIPAERWRKGGGVERNVGGRERDGARFIPPGRARFHPRSGFCACTRHLLPGATPPPAAGRP
jgi:hypothetical protein